MSEERPRTIKAMLAEAKDTSELMLDLAHAGLFYNDKDLSGEVLELEDDLNRLVHGMREVCLLASRSPSDAAGLAALLQVIGSIETIGNQAVDIAKIILENLGIPTELRLDLREAEEVVDRAPVREGSQLDGHSVGDLEERVEELRILAIRRGPQWIFDPDNEERLIANDSVIVRGDKESIPMIRTLAGLGARELPHADDVGVNPTDRAIDIVVEMKNLAEVSVGLAYAAVLFADRDLASEVNRLEDRLDDMRETLEHWVLDAAQDSGPRPELRGLLHVAVASESIGDAAQSMVWLIERGEELHPIIAEALGEAEDVIGLLQIDAGSAADGQMIRQMDLHGMAVLALSRRGRWTYRPSKGSLFVAGEQVVVVGPAQSLEDVKALLEGPPLEQDPVEAEVGSA